LRTWRAWVAGLTAVCALAACGAHRVATPADGDTPQPPRPVSGQTVISLTFDDAYQNQWRYAVPLLRAHHMSATFYVITADSNRRCCMSWSQLRALQEQGDDVGSHTVSHPYLTQLLEPDISAEVCGSRQDMIARGIYNPQSFAYPFGTYNAAIEDVVKACGYTNARQGGGVSRSNILPGPPYTESLPPRDPFAVRTIAVNGASPIRLSDLKSFVIAAARHEGHWLPITFHNVCRAQSADYNPCMSSYGPIQDIVLAKFLSWLAATGERSGAPAGIVVRTMQQAVSERP
jgi:peptidoglycan/xylan/chitin deacetylase (PgdA/CDA1 family)